MRVVRTFILALTLAVAVPALTIGPAGSPMGTLARADTLQPLKVDIPGLASDASKMPSDAQLKPAGDATVKPPADAAAKPPAEAGAKKPTDDPKANLAAWKLEIEQVAAGLTRKGQTDRDLEAARVRAEVLRKSAGDLADEQAPRLAAVQARLKQLGPAPKADANDANAGGEADGVRDERRQQEALAAELDGIVKQAAVVQLEADEIIKAIANERRDRFSRLLFAKTSSILDPTLWLDATVAVPRTVSSLVLLLHDWGGLLVTRATDSAWAALAVAFLVFGLLISPVRRRLVTATERDAKAIEPAALRKALAASAIVLVNVGLPLIGLLAIQWTLRILELSPERIDHTVGALLDATTSAMGLSGLAFAVLSPSKPQWRMARFGDGDAHRLNRLFVLMAVLYGAGTFFVDLVSALFAPVALTVVLTGVTALVDVSLVMLVLRTFARAIGADHEPAPGAEPGAVHEEETERSRLWRWLLPLTWLAAIAVVVSALLGYVALARFIVDEMVWAGSVLAVLFITLIVIDEAITAIVDPGTRTSEVLVRSMGLTRSTVEQLAVILSGLVRIAAILAALLVIVAPLGITFADMRDYARDAFFGFKVGGLTISLSAVFIGLFVFFALLAATKTSQRWLEDRFLPRTQMDAGLKNSIRTAFGYAGFVVAAMVGMSSAGIGLENVAIIAGALSVGLGFGLQSIVNNFVSGLILLIERPIKTGDVVEIGAVTGTVRKINVRSTEIETADRASVLVPNSSVILGNVKNWMHRDASGRCVVEISVPYGSDPDKIREILIGCAADHKLALIFPAPGAFLIAFEPAAMRFRLSCTVANVNDGFGVESDLRIAVVKRLKENGIDIVPPPRPIAIEGLDLLVERLVAEKASKETPSS